MLAICPIYFYLLLLIILYKFRVRPMGWAHELGPWVASGLRTAVSASCEALRRGRILRFRLLGGFSSFSTQKSSSILVLRFWLGGAIFNMSTSRSEFHLFIFFFLSPVIFFIPYFFSFYSSSSLLLFEETLRDHRGMIVGSSWD